MNDTTLANYVTIRIPEPESSRIIRLLKVVIQHKISFKYVRSDAEWTDDATKAHDFERIQAAAHFCQTHELKDAYIVSGEFNSDAKRFNAATKSILDVAQIRSHFRQ